MLYRFIPSSFGWRKWFYLILFRGQVRVWYDADPFPEGDAPRFQLRIGRWTPVTVR